MSILKSVGGIISHLISLRGSQVLLAEFFSQRPPSSTRSAYLGEVHCCDSHPQITFKSRKSRRSIERYQVGSSQSRCYFMIERSDIQKHAVEAAVVDFTLTFVSFIFSSL
jgi:hypothetical protein